MGPYDKAFSAAVCLHVDCDDVSSLPPSLLSTQITTQTEQGLTMISSDIVEGVGVEGCVYAGWCWWERVSTRGGPDDQTRSRFFMGVDTLYMGGSRAECSM